MADRLQSGLYTMQIWVVDSEDYPMGTLTTPNSPVNGTVYNAYVVPSVVTYTAAADTVESVESYGSMELRGRREMGTSAFGDGTIETSEFDDVLDALVMGYVLDTTTGTALRIAGHNVNRAVPLKFMIGLTSAATPSNGTPNFDTTFTWGTLRRGALGFNQQTGRNPNNRTYTLTKVLSKRTPWGQLFSSSTLAPTGGKDDEVTIYTDAPISLSTRVADGTASAFNLPYALSYTAAASFNSANLIFMNGTATAQSVVNVSGGTAVVTNGALISANKWIVLGPSVALLNA